MFRKVYDYELYTPNEMMDAYYGCHVMCKEYDGKYRVVAFFIEDEYSTKKERNKFFKLMKPYVVKYADYTINTKTLSYEDFMYAINNIKRLKRLHRRLLSKRTFKVIKNAIKEELNFQKYKLSKFRKTVRGGLDGTEEHIYIEEEHM